MHTRTVTWNDAQAFCAWRGMGLPTEWEWEHAARDPSLVDEDTAYTWGASLRVCRRVCVCVCEKVCVCGHLNV
jgi:formylglycine-generating enzyme required for sulfatase activity